MHKKGRLETAPRASPSGEDCEESFRTRPSCRPLSLGVKRGCPPCPPRAGRSPRAGRTSCCRYASHGPVWSSAEQRDDLRISKQSAFGDAPKSRKSPPQIAASSDDCRFDPELGLDRVIANVKSCDKAIDRRLVVIPSDDGRKVLSCVWGISTTHQIVEKELDKTRQSRVSLGR